MHTSIGIDAHITWHTWRRAGMNAGEWLHP
jgi:hypothetical protein